MLIMNNWSVHIALKVNEFWIKNHIRILIIAPSCPSLKLIEKFTLKIKSKIRSYLSEGGIFYSKILQNFIYNTAAWNLSGFESQVTKKLFVKWRILRKFLLNEKNW